MKSNSNIKITSIILAGATLFTSCASTTLIQSNPIGAKVYIQGEYAGTTPYSYKDTKIVGSTTDLKIEKEGYEPFSTSFSRNEKADVGAIIGGIFVLVPFLWTMKYKDQHTYELIPLGAGAKKEATTDTSIATKLQELKKMYDDKLITKEEYEQQREKVLNNYSSTENKTDKKTES
ncbi:PEGA domain-containing protein [Sphingobacterium detergens]|uniref:Putative oligomerization/nucleic acid binding protein n=1 Tax=Sphingobacterium detergens TaxID=1145106 RepID=A0A420AXZ4_SPHD1|nr:PEGA domain-containing protein [Sphingobacterium detergens]RKE49352.1 putative oligomerization/nucleic acid binding protein [Sphingobacterium detergens]